MHLLAKEKENQSLLTIYGDDNMFDNPNFHIINN
jgi:hypothetical protein